MLYDRWREIATNRGSEIALREFSSGRAWTFAQMLDQSDRSDDPGEGWLCPRGNDAGFVFEILRGWRHGRVVCPLEQSDGAPDFASPPRNIVHVKRTSATTGAARFIAFTAEQITADPANVVTTMGLRPDCPNLAAISLAHSYGFSNLVLPLLLHGIPLFLVSSPLPEALRSACASGNAFTLAGVPALWRAWHEGNVISDAVKLAISAGAPLPLKLEEDVFTKCGVKIHNFLGASECGGIAYDRTAVPRTDAALVGQALDNVALSANQDLLEVRGAAVADGYWPEGQATLSERVFRTSDIVDVRGGLLYMRGRANDVIHIAGRKVAPEEIERALAQHSAVKECLVFDAPRTAAENQIVAIVAAPSAEADSIRHFLAHRLPAWQLPRQWRFVEALPANERGKLSRAQWRKRFLDSEV